MQLFFPIKNTDRSKSSLIFSTVRNPYSSSYSTSFAVALDSNGYAWAWGLNSVGQLGNRGTADQSLPTSVIGRRFSKITVTLSSCLAIDLNGYAWAWGGGTSGQLGNNTASAISSPVSVLGDRRFSFISGNNAGSFIALDLNGYAWAWGAGTSGRLGNGLASSQSSPVSVLGGRRFQSIPINTTNLTLALDLDGYAWAWGSGGSGQLGNNSTASASSPVSVLGGRRFSTAIGMFSGATAIALDLNGYAWAWGEGTVGQLGNNAAANASSPVSVVGDRRFSSISSGNNTAVVIDLNGYAWAWGLNSSGQSGNNTAANASSPVSVVGSRRFSAIFTGPSHTIALDLNSYAWAWGVGGSGQLGNNSTANASSPVSVVGGKRFSLISNIDTGFVAAIDTDGYAWGWGVGTNGQLGEEFFAVNRSSPVSVMQIRINPTNTFGK